MNLHEIKAAIAAGHVVHWSNSSYRVILDRVGQYLIVCDNGSCVGLTWADGSTMNGDERQFYIRGTR